MARFEMNANGTRSQPVVYGDSHEPEYFFDSVGNSVVTLPSTVTSVNPDQWLYNPMYNVPPSDSVVTHNGQDESYNFGAVAPGYVEPRVQSSWWSCPGVLSEYILDNSEFSHIGADGAGDMSDGMLEELFREPDCPPAMFNSESRIETEENNVYSPLSALSSDSVRVSDSTLTSGPTMTTSLEPEDDLAEDQNSLEGITSWPAPELIPAIDDHSKFVSDESPCQAQQSMFEGVSKYGINAKRKRSAKSNKYSAEIRISKKISKDGKYQKEKAWLGTFATPAQKERALDVGKFFLCTKKKKNFFDPNSEAILSTFKDRLQALPLTELVEIVTKMAKHYGEKGSLPETLNDL